MKGKRFTFDTNILVYSMDNDADKKHELAITLLDGSIGFVCVLTLQSLTEFFSVVTRKSKMPLAEARDQINDWMELYPVISGTQKTLTHAMGAVINHSFSFWDAMIWAVSYEAGVSYIISEDFQDGRELNGVHFLNPFQMDKNKINEILFK